MTDSVPGNNIQKLTENEWIQIYNNSENTWLLGFIKNMENEREYLVKDDYLKSTLLESQLNDLLLLTYQLLNNDETTPARNLFNYASDLERDISGLIDNLTLLKSNLNSLLTDIPEIKNTNK